MYRVIWVQGGFVCADGMKIGHGDAIIDLLLCSWQRKLAIVKCTGLKTNSSVITRGNNAADEAAKQTAGIYLNNKQ